MSYRHNSAAGQVVTQSAYVSPNGSQVATNTSLDSLFSDDFGGNAVSTTNWDVIDGGLAAIVSGTIVTQLGATPTPNFSQAKIGSGTTGMTDSVASSGLTVNMNTTNGAERWYLSQQVFAGKEDILVILSKSQPLAANSIFVGLVEVDPVYGIPLLNPNFAADGNGSSEFTNRGGCEFGLTTGVNSYQAEAIGDSSAAKATGNVGVANAVSTTTQEYLVEIDSRDIIISNGLVDNVGGKTANASRVSTQCPNDKKLYKLVMRFKNVSAPGSNTSVVVQRVLVIDNYEQRVQLSSGEGDQIAAKAVAVNLVGANATSGVLGGVALSTNSAFGTNTYHKLTSAATTNATSVKNSITNLVGGSIRNRNASERYVKFYNKASAPTVGTDVPIITIGVPTGLWPLAEILGAYAPRFTTGLAYAITGAYADSDTTAVGAGDVDINLLYN